MALVSGSFNIWVDRRRTDRDVGQRRRVGEVPRVDRPQMIRAAADWLYAYRWWPWLVILLFLPPMVWPSSWWLDVRTVHIADTRVGDTPVMLVDREVRRSFQGQWNVTIRQWDGAGWLTYCNATGRSNYRAGARFPEPLTLQWWGDGQCHPLPRGKYRVSTHWVIATDAPLPDKHVTAESNIFAVE